MDSQEDMESSVGATSPKHPPNGDLGQSEDSSAASAEEPASQMASDDLEEHCPGRMLQQAAIYNNTEFMESLLQGPERFHINEQDLYGRTPLYTSVTNNSLECAHMLLQCGGEYIQCIV